MADKNFTSGEKRGLIALVTLMAVIVGWTLMSRSCGSSRDVICPAEVSDTITPKATVKVKSGDDSTSTRRKKKKTVNKNRRPDGKQRDYLSEPAYDN